MSTLPLHYTPHPSPTPHEKYPCPKGSQLHMQLGLLPSVSFSWALPGSASQYLFQGSSLILYQRHRRSASQGLPQIGLSVHFHRASPGLASQYLFHRPSPRLVAWYLFHGASPGLAAQNVFHRASSRSAAQYLFYGASPGWASFSVSRGLPPDWLGLLSSGSAAQVVLPSVLHSHPECVGCNKPIHVYCFS